MYIHGLTALYQQAWFITLAVILGVIVLTALIILLTFVLLRQTSKKAVRDLSNRYDSIHNSFSTDCSNMIKRIETIAENNSNFSAISESVHKRFNSILTETDKNCYVAVESLKSLIGQKKYKGIKAIIDSTRGSMDAFSKEAIELNNDLQNILKKEDDLRAKIVVLKEKFRRLKEKFYENQEALASLEPSFDMLFDHLTNCFIEFEESLNKADYEKANNSIPEADKLLEATNKVMTDLPYLNSLASNVVPERIEELKQAYKEMEDQNYPLHHLFMKKKIEAMNKSLEICRERLKKLSTYKVADTLNGITMEITGYFNDFEKERQAKTEFDLLQDAIRNSSYQAEKQYASLKSSLPSYQKVYVISPTYLQQINIIKGMIDDMSTKKRLIDGMINSATKQAYSMLVSSMKDLKAKIDRIQKAFDDFHDYLLELKHEVETAHKFIHDGFIKVKELALRVNEIGVGAISEIYNTRLNDELTMLSDIEKMINATPIDVIKLTSIYNDALKNLNELEQEIADNEGRMKTAEELIVYCNVYRAESIEARNSLKVAEKAFFEGDFLRASSVAAEVYKTMSGKNE